MKSYSDDIPNVSTDELKRSAAIADETNGLVKKNLGAINELGIHMEAHLRKIRAQGALNTFLLVLTLGVSTVALVLAGLPFFRG